MAIARTSRTKRPRPRRSRPGRGVTGTARRPRGRPRQLGVIRPACPHGHPGEPTMAGRYAVGPFHERRRWRCATGHLFITPLPPRHPLASHPHSGSACAYCEREYTPVDGPITPQEFTFSVREIAAALIAVGTQTPMRDAASRARRNAQRVTTIGYGIERASKEANIVAAWIDGFTDAALAGSEPTHWPRVLLLDAVPLRDREWRENRWIQSGRPRGSILAAYGYLPPAVEDGSAIGQLWRVAVSGAGDRPSWVEFLRSLPDDPAGPPLWVVGDGDSAIRRAVAEVWPDATFFSCEWHLKNRARKVLGMPVGPAGTNPLLDALEAALRSAEDWETFLSDLATYPPEQTRQLYSWIAKHENTIRTQHELRKLPGLPHATGPLESAFDQLMGRLGQRIYVFRNVERLNRVLRLMRADMAKLTDEHLFHRRLKAHLLSQQGRANTDWVAHRIGHGGTDLLALVAAAQQRRDANHRETTRARNARNRALRLAEAAAIREAAGQPASGRQERNEPAGYRSVAGKVVADFPDVLAEWHPTLNRGLDPTTIRAGSQMIVNWRCTKLHTFPGRIITRTARRQRCPYCSNRLASDTNNLAAVFPLVAAEWHPTRNKTLRPEDVTYGSNKSVWWKCPKRHVYRARISSRTSMGTGCRKCGTRATPFITDEDEIF